MDRIAKTGLRYTEFHSTALCSPSRAAIITGRNHHSVGFGVIAEQATGYPGYDAIIGIVATFFVTRGSQYPNVGARKTEFMLASPGKV
jgi:hypothetical protein